MNRIRNQPLPLALIVALLAMLMGAFASVSIARAADPPTSASVQEETRKGESLTSAAAPVPRPAPASQKPAPPRLFFKILVALSVVILVGRLLGLAFRRFHQPPVIGEVLAGILLGPSLLGRISRDAMFLWPAH